MKTQLHTKSQDKKGESQSKAFEKSRIYVVHNKKHKMFIKKIQEQNVRSKGQKKRKI